VGTRAGCTGKAAVQIRIKFARPGPDKTVRQARKVVGNGRITASVRCTAGSRTYYVVVTDSGGNVSQSKAVRLRCASGSPTTPTGNATGTAAEQEVVRLTNEARNGKGCGALVHDPKLHTAALRHSKDMAAQGYFAHNSQDGRDPGDRITAAGFAPIHAWGENIALGQPTPAAVVRAWLNSPGHRANIMNCSFTHIGVGLAKGSSGPYWTQDFGAH
jgi:uncharacterized protein YkwD